MKKTLPIISIILALMIQILVPSSDKHPNAASPYFTYALCLGLGVYIVVFMMALFRPGLNKTLNYKGQLIGGAVLLLNIINLLTVKLAWLPTLYFPSLDRVFGALVEDRVLLGKCLLYSARLLSVGFFSGVIAGLATGILIGFNKTANYWIMPVVRILGPIPSTAWIPLVLVCFPTAVSASTR